MKKIGIITMHTPNCGSVLQTYATQVKLEELGFDASVIDYVYPTKWHASRRDPRDSNLKPKGRSPINFGKYLFQSFQRRLTGTKREKTKAHRLKHGFIKTRLNLTPVRYGSADKLRKEPPICDVYLTGSDQVWNPRFAVGDTVFLCDFAPPDAPKVSYAASFATDTIPDRYKAEYVRYLSMYKAISVRERSGVTLVKSLTDKQAELVCDPSLLVDQKVWQQLAEESALPSRKPYILAHIPTYAYNPYPKIVKFVDDLKQQTGLDAIYIFGDRNEHHAKDDTFINALGPADYVRMFRDADFVITTSLHSTAFSLIFEKPMYAIVEDASGDDSRMMSLLQEVGAANRAIPITASKISAEDMDYVKITANIHAWRKRSTDFLTGCLSEN